MTLEETKKLLMAIDTMYPTFKVENPIVTAETWHWALEDYPADAIMAALQIYVKTNKTGFAPSVSQLIGGIQSVKHNDELTEGEAWVLVKKAIGDSGYHAKERFDELPETVQKAVGSPSILQGWGMCDSEDVNTVIMSNFQRAYKAELSRKEFNDNIPATLTDIIKGLSEKVSPRIEENE